MATGIMVTAALAMTQIPLVADFGFEFAVLTAFIATFCTGFMIINAFTDWRSRGQKVTFLSLSAILYGLSLSILIPPLAIMLLKNAIGGGCDVFNGIAFYLLIPGVTVLWSTAVSSVCALVTENRSRAKLIFVVVIFVSIGISLYRLATEPPVFSYNPIIGYFPGPIYDEVIRITPTLIWARVIVLVSVLTIVTGLYTCFDTETRKIRPSRILKSGNRKPNLALITTRILFITSLTALATAYLYRSPLGIIIDKNHIQKILLGHKQTTHFDIYYDLSSKTAQNINLIALEHEYQLNIIAEYLKVPLPSVRVESYIYADADQKKRLMGARHTSIERPGANEMHLNNTRFPNPVLKHELVHVLSASFGNLLYGGSYSMGFHEGLAVAVDWPSSPMNPHEWSRAMRLLGIAPPLKDLLNTMKFWSAASSRSYTICGSFVRFLIERYGISTFKQAFPNGNVIDAYEQELEELIVEWETFIDNIKLQENELQSARQRFFRPSIFNRHCAREVAILKDYAWKAYSAGRYAEAVDSFNHALELDPDDPSSLKGVLYSTFMLGDYRSTNLFATRLIELPNQIMGLLADAHLVRGDLAWQLGSIDKARRDYSEILDLKGPENITRAASIRLDVLNRDIFRDTLMTYLSRANSEENLIMSVRDAINLTTDHAVAYYLVGRWLFFADSYKEALLYLSKADTLELPSDLLRQESLRLEALCQFHIKDYERAASTFQRLAALYNNRSIARRSEIWIERCRWYQKLDNSTIK